MLTDEHIIPKSVAGRLIAAFLCRDCNSSLGHNCEYAARSDPTIRLLAKQLGEKIPGIAREMAENQPHIAIGPGEGEKHGFVRDGAFHINSSFEADGSLIQSTPKARKSMARMLRKEGYDPEFIAHALWRFDEAPENVRMEITPNISVVKWEITGLAMALAGPPMNPVVPLKAAYEFLALHLGAAIYERSPPLNEVRRVLAGGDLDPNWIAIDRLEAPVAQPFHGIVFEGNSPHAKVQIRLFGKLAFRIHFLRMAVGGSRFQYTHALDTGKEFISESPADRAKRKNQPAY